MNPWHYASRQSYNTFKGNSFQKDAVEDKPNNSVEDIGASRAESSRWALCGEGKTNGIKEMQRARKRRA
jgi:hypothetical protein